MARRARARRERDLGRAAAAAGQRRRFGEEEAQRLLRGLCEAGVDARAPPPLAPARAPAAAAFTAASVVAAASVCSRAQAAHGVVPLRGLRRGSPRRGRRGAAHAQRLEALRRQRQVQLACALVSEQTRDRKKKKNVTEQQRRRAVWEQRDGVALVVQRRGGGDGVHAAARFARLLTELRFHKRGVAQLRQRQRRGVEERRTAALQRRGCVQAAVLERRARERWMRMLSGSKSRPPPRPRTGRSTSSAWLSGWRRSSARRSPVGCDANDRRARRHGPPSRPRARAMRSAQNTGRTKAQLACPSSASFRVLRSLLQIGHLLSTSMDTLP